MRDFEGGGLQHRHAMRPGRRSGDGPRHPGDASADRSIEAHARLRDHLLAADSATQALQSWCESNRLASGPVSVILEHRKTDPAPPEEAMDSLLLGHEVLVYRRVTLVCGTLAVAKAENWFVRDRLPLGALARMSEHADVPFGTALAPFGMSRRTTAARLPSFCRIEGTAGDGAGPGPDRFDVAVELDAVVRCAGQDVAYVRERFSEILVV